MSLITVVRLSIIILILAGILTSSFSKVILFTGFIINQEKIIQQHCENKSKPSLKCHGKCHLQKQFKAQEKNDGDSRKNTSENFEIQLFSCHSVLKIKKLTATAIRLHPTNKDSKKYTYKDPEFHPPCSTNL